MAHKPGNEYQIRIVREDGTEKLSGWTSSIEQVAQAVILARKPHGTTCWLLVRNIICPNCLEIERIIEYPIMEIPSPRYNPHDSRYIQLGGARNRCA
jgi:hypothetical protein